MVYGSADGVSFIKRDLNMWQWGSTREWRMKMLVIRSLVIYRDPRGNSSRNSLATYLSKIIAPFRMHDAKGRYEIGENYHVYLCIPFAASLHQCSPISIFPLTISTLTNRRARHEQSMYHRIDWNDRLFMRDIDRVIITLTVFPARFQKRIVCYSAPLIGYRYYIEVPLAYWLLAIYF